ncbi:MAG: hypothetical protein GHCLOJNM_01587 [bacterium]|nr:hypothetical protein [bacterium]
MMAEERVKRAWTKIEETRIVAHEARERSRELGGEVEDMEKRVEELEETVRGLCLVVAGDDGSDRP